MRLIDADELKTHKFLTPQVRVIGGRRCGKTREQITEAYQQGWNDAIDAIIDNAPTVLHDNYSMGYQDGVRKVLSERPQGKREFIEILAQNVPEDVCIYPEYKGKPYYSIHYKENGEEFVGFSTYKPEVLSRFLRNYFMEEVRKNDR